MNFFDYFQITSLAVFLLIFFGRTIQLKRRGIKVFRIGRGKKGFSALLEKSFLIFFPFWLLELLIHSLHLNIQFLPFILAEPFFVHPVVQGIGALVILICLAVFSFALVSFKSSWRIGIDTEAPGALITTGIFSLSRNPIFLSMDLYFLGSFLIYSNVFFLLCLMGMAAGMHVQIREEEKFLIRRYGGHYQRYMTQVHRYI